MFVLGIVSYGFVCHGTKGPEANGWGSTTGKQHLEKKVSLFRGRPAAASTRVTQRVSWRLSCTGQTDQYMKWLESTRRPSGSEAATGTASARPLSYLEQLEQRRLQPQQADTETMSNGQTHPAIQHKGKIGFFERLRILFGVSSTEKSTAMQKLRAYGLAAVLAYGIFDAITYSTSFLIALITFKRATNNAPLTWQNLLKVVAGMWIINNFSRPFRIAGALLLAPFVDRHIVKPLSTRLRRKRSAPSA
jgi:hypothetical protein